MNANKFNVAVVQLISENLCAFILKNWRYWVRIVGSCRDAGHLV